MSRPDRSSGPERAHRGKPAPGASRPGSARGPPCPAPSDETGNGSEGPAPRGERPPTASQMVLACGPVTSGLSLPSARDHRAAAAARSEGISADYSGREDAPNDQISADWRRTLGLRPGNDRSPDRSN